MVAHARAAAPNECGGLLLARAISSFSDEEATITVTDAKPIAAIFTSPTRFELNPLSLMDGERATRRRGLKLVGYYHSHPLANNAAWRRDLAPSSADLASETWPGLGPRLRIIVSPSGVWRAFLVSAKAWMAVAAGKMFGTTE